MIRPYNAKNDMENEVCLQKYIIATFRSFWYKIRPVICRRTFTVAIELSFQEKNPPNVLIVWTGTKHVYCALMFFMNAKI